MNDSIIHSASKKKASTWNWRPVTPLENSPVFSQPLNLAKIINWFRRSWLQLSMTLILLSLSIFAWRVLQPPLVTMQQFEIGWISQILLRNLIFVIILAGGLHLYFHRHCYQGDEHKYVKREFAKNNNAFTLNNQVWDNIFWTLSSGVPIWSAYEVLYMWSSANGYIPSLPAQYTGLWMVLMIFLTPLWLSFHFYWVHRLLHWRPLYKRVHSLHHRNVHIGPWSGLTMHPVEHLGYFSSILIHLIVPSNPLIMYFHLYLQALNPIASHSGFDDLLIKKKSVLPLGVFFHQLHHRYFECNYGTADIPWDKWFGSFHDGSDEATEKMQQERLQKARQQ